MRDVDRALENIENIRSQISAGRMFKGFGPLIIGLSGALAFCVAWLQIIRPETFAATPQRLLLVWVSVAIVVGLFIAIETYARSRRHHGLMAKSMTGQAAEAFIPAGLAGGMTLLVFSFHAPDLMWVLPGLWQILLAIAVFSARRFLPKTVILVAAWYFICGVGVLILTATARDILPWHMGLPFAVGQVLMAAILYFAVGT